MASNLSGFAVLFILGLVTALGVYGLLRKSLHALLENVLRLPTGAEFYARVLALGLVLIALSAILGTTFDLKEDSALMEYVWKIAGGLSTAFGHTSLFLTGYLIVITVLVAVLRRRDE